MSNSKKELTDPPTVGHVKKAFDQAQAAKIAAQKLEPLLQLLETPEGETSPIEQLQEILEAILYEVRQIIDVREDQKLILKNQRDMLKKLDVLLLRQG